MATPQKPEYPINTKGWEHKIYLSGYEGCSLSYILNDIKDKSAIDDLQKIYYDDGDYGGPSFYYQADRFTAEQYAKLLEKYEKDLKKYNEYELSEEFLNKKKKNNETHLKRLETQKNNLEKQLKKIDSQLKKQLNDKNL